MVSEFKESALQNKRYSSPWTFKSRVGILLWSICWTVFCSITPKPFKSWRLFWLRLFGAKIEGRPFVHPKARIQIPWHIHLKDHSCVGERANLYSLGPILLEEYVVIAQEAYLCTGTHNLEDPKFALMTAGITVKKNAFIAARAFVMPGLTIGENSVVGACSVVTKSVEKDQIVAGNPARFVSLRKNVENV